MYYTFLKVINAFINYGAGALRIYPILFWSYVSEIRVSIYAYQKAHLTQPGIRTKVFALSKELSTCTIQLFWILCVFDFKTRQGILNRVLNKLVKTACSSNLLIH